MSGRKTKTVIFVNSTPRFTLSHSEYEITIGDRVALVFDEVAHVEKFALAVARMHKDLKDERERLGLRP